MNIGILICGHFVDEIKATYGTYRDLYAELLGPDYHCTPYFIVDGEIPGSVEEQDGWLISGSRSGAYEDLPWIPPLEDFLRQAYAADVPLVGICFGHQVLAQALGGKVEKFKGGWSFGPVDYGFVDGSTQTIVAVHQDQVVSPPTDASVTARTDFCAFAGLAYKGRAISFQPHPEFSSQFIADLTDIYADRLTPDVIAGARAVIDKPLDSNRMADQIRAFLQTGATPPALPPNAPW